MALLLKPGGHAPEVDAAAAAPPRSAIATECSRYVLTVHEWSALSYGKHASKTDRIPLNTKKPAGYKLAVGVFLSEQAGEMPAPA